MSSLFSEDELPPPKRAIDPTADAFLRPASEVTAARDEATAEAQAQAYAIASGNCEECREVPAVHYLSCYDRQGNHLPNRFVCNDCLPAAEAEAKAAGRCDKFPADLGLSKLKGEHR